jgi:RNA-binding protein
MALTGKQRAYLRGLAHHKNPVVMVGSAGVSDEVLQKVVVELGLHELIKVKVGDAPIDVNEVAPLLVDGTGAELVQVIGHVVILYKKRKKNPEIRLPKASDPA